MNKNDLVSKIAKETGVTKTLAAKSLDAILGSITEALVKGGGVQLVGFGTFQTVKRAARTGRNPSTGKAIKIPAKKVPKFKPGKALTQAVK